MVASGSKAPVEVGTDPDGLPTKTPGFLRMFLKDIYGCFFFDHRIYDGCSFLNGCV